MPYTTPVCTPRPVLAPYGRTGEAVHLHGVWVAGLLVTCSCLKFYLLIAYNYNYSQQGTRYTITTERLDLWVRGSARRCCRFSGLYAFHWSHSVGGHIYLWWNCFSRSGPIENRFHKFARICPLFTLGLSKSLFKRDDRRRKSSNSGL